jgi:hypothetical protein
MIFVFDIVNIYLHYTDQSVGLHEDNRTRDGTMQQVLDCSRLTTGRILLAPHILMSRAAVDLSSYSSDSFAWDETEGSPFCKITEPVPVSNIRWARISLKCAFQGWHLSPDGFGTALEIKSGCEWVIIARPCGRSDPNKPGLNPDFNDMGLLHLFLNNFDSSVPNEDNWDIEAVVLAAGSRL